MRLVAFVVAGLVAGSAQALAQYQYAPRPVMPIGPLPPASVFEMVRQMGLEPMGPPMRNGAVYIQRAADYYGKPLRVVIDAHRAQVVSVEAVGGPPMLHRGPYASAGNPYWRRPYGPYGAMPPYNDDDDYAPPGSVMAPHGQPPQTGLPPASQAKPKSAAVTPGRPPVPRKRPAAAPQETAGSIEPIAPAPQDPPAAAPPPAKPATPEMTPVAPLN
ncbi:MAG: hypothetical protein QOH67_3310 [Hyphomicrobiales bacterium]|nr:hypothetical protein [Hyphomicrobiales bacterium]